MSMVNVVQRIKQECIHEGYTERYCEWRFNYDHWPYQDTSPYPLFKGRIFQLEKEPK